MCCYSILLVDALNYLSQGYPSMECLLLPFVSRHYSIALFLLLNECCCVQLLVNHSLRLTLACWPIVIERKRFRTRCRTAKFAQDAASWGLTAFCAQCVAAPVRQPAVALACAQCSHRRQGSQCSHRRQCSHRHQGSHKQRTKSGRRKYLR